jgi:hypothetical protein
VEFGQEVGATDLGAVAASLKTYSESVARDDQLKQWLPASGQIVFLGCAYHAQNMSLIRSTLQRPAAIYGTACGHSTPDQIVFREELAQWQQDQHQTPERIKIDPVPCSKMVAKWQNTWRREVA